MPALPDPRSSLTAKLMTSNPSAYTELVFTRETPPESLSLLKDVTPGQLVDGEVKSWPAAYAVLAALWLWHDGLEECHRIVQQTPQELEAAALNLHRKRLEVYQDEQSVPPVENHNAGNSKALAEMTDTLSFWHAIMHRREGDFGNSKYWYAKCRSHPALMTIAAQANEAIARADADKALLRLTMSGWNGPAFVDYVQAVHESPSDPRYGIAVALQQMEWRVLFDYCVRGATGK